MATLKLESNENAIIMRRQETGESERISVTAPMLNINGASGDMLIEQQRQVLDALRELGRAIKAAAPHGRDFQTDRTGTKYEAARKEFERECDFIFEMEARHEEIVARVFNQINGRG